MSWQFLSFSYFLLEFLWEFAWVLSLFGLEFFQNVQIKALQYKGTRDSWLFLKKHPIALVSTWSSILLGAKVTKEGATEKELVHCTVNWKLSIFIDFEKTFEFVRTKVLRLQVLSCSEKIFFSIFQVANFLIAIKLAAI